MLAVARVRVHRAIRTRLVLAALVLALLPWCLVESSALLVRLSSLAEFTLAGLAALGAGVLSDDIDSGEYAIALTHDCSPVEVLAGQGAASLALIAVLVLLQLPIALYGVSRPGLSPLLFSLAWVVALSASWLGLLMLLGTVLDGKANAVAMVAALAIVPLLVGGGILDRAPRTLAMAVHGALQLLPQMDHATKIVRSLVLGTPVPVVPSLVLLVSPVLYFALALVRLYRLEPAGRLTQ